MAQSNLHAYAGKILRVNLTTGSIFIEPKDRYTKVWLGDSDLIQWILHNERAGC